MPSISDELTDLLSQIHLLAEERAIYRGEAKCHEQVSSGLYRKLQDLGVPELDVMEVQKHQLKEAHNYESIEDDEELLTTIQHLGGKTNLIDFTKDLNIALFFAASDSPHSDGRVVRFMAPAYRWDRPASGGTRQLGFDPRYGEDYKVIPAKSPSKMVDAQKSVVVRPKLGYIREEDLIIVRIPHELKAEIIDYLRHGYGIDHATVFNEISGYIQYQDRLLNQMVESHKER